MSEEEMFPRELSAREFAWIEWLLPADRPGYARLMDRVRKLFVIGEGRWGKNDFVLGGIGTVIDRTEGMRPVVAFGHLHGNECDLTISLHAPDDDGHTEFQISSSNGDIIPTEFHTLSKWTYSIWFPGEPCPATGAPVREIVLPTAKRAGLRLVLSREKRVLWLHDPEDLTNLLIPVTNFYNELMLVKSIRDPKIALDHKLLFTDDERFSNAELANAFIRYNVLYNKVGVALFDEPQTTRASVWSRLFKRSSR